MEFKQRALTEMPVLDIRGLSDTQNSLNVDDYETLCTQMLLPFPQVANDPVRQAIDAAISEALGLPDLAILRMLLAQEPAVFRRALPQRVTRLSIQKQSCFSSCCTLRHFVLAATQLLNSTLSLSWR